ncbi:MAG TPA: L-histidine N(alpha)-methyltransferase [Acidimicrobiales bacterium]|nr:L-histidine N(alpha)-methyltransferase [Acidimicrobiales bacterium]
MSGGPDLPGGAEPGRVTVDVCLTPEDLQAALRRDARRGLTSVPKAMPPVWFYDDRGCELYEQITRTPEYYPFRTERALLQAAGPAIAAISAASVLVELGSGTSEKTRLLLGAMAAGPAGLGGYVPMDVAEPTLRAAAGSVAAELGVDVHAVVGDFREHLDRLPAPAAPRRLVAFLGSTVGNLLPAERARFLADVAALLGPDDAFLLATDLVKPVERLIAAYDDAGGVTAAFDRNLLSVLNRELGADFEVHRFAHRAVWDADNRWIEMRLVATEAMTVKVPELDLVVDFAAGEEVRTEVSAKFTPEGTTRELGHAGLAVAATWTDPAGDYLLTLARRGGAGPPGGG